MKVFLALLVLAFCKACLGAAVLEDDPDFPDIDVAQQVLLLSEGMWLAAENVGDDIKLDLQDEIEKDSDKDYDKLIKEADKNIFEKDTVKALNKLFNVYRTDKTESREQTDFINKIMLTYPMGLLQSYLINETVVEDAIEFRTEFKRIWFDSFEYGEGENRTITSGFNHVYMGEIDDNDNAHGFHNWVRFYNEEQDGALTYRGFRNFVNYDDKLKIADVSFEWNDAVKPISTIAFGALPEYEMAVLTLCYYRLPGEKCYVAMGDDYVNVVTVTAEVDQKEYVRTAYFSLVDPDDSDGSGSLRPDLALSFLFSLFYMWRNFVL